MPLQDPQQQADRETNEFENTFTQVQKNEEMYGTPDPIFAYDEFISPLGQKLNDLFMEYERDRRDLEDRWVMDLRQFRGEYDPEILDRLHPKRSKAFFNITRTKTKTVSARQTDLLFPANGDKNWSIRPTEIPELNPAVIENLKGQYMNATGQEAPEEMIKKFINKESNRRSYAMEKEMEDQLQNIKYREIIRNVILSGNLYGTGILKGPLVKQEKSKRWLPSPDRTDWVPVELSKLLPYCEHVPVWDIYPDMTARTIDDARGVFQRYVMTRNKVYELSSRSDFNGAAIRAYIRAVPDGDAELKTHESELRQMNPAGNANSGYKETSAAGVANIGSGGSIHDHKGRYEVKEFWGYLNTDELIESGIDVDQEKMGLEVACNVWMIGPVVIKAIISPIEGASTPYHFYYFDKDDTSIWGEGIPTIMRDPQKLLNAAVRAMLDNAAMSAGPIVEANMDLLDSNEDPNDLYPFRVFLRDGMGSDATAPAIRVYNVSSYTNEFMAMINFFLNAADEVTAIPRYMYGDTNTVGGAGKTATGLSMLMGAANVTLKDQVKNFDDGITKPFIKALYFWNMDFNPKEHIKGDFGVVAKGATSLIAREVKAESLNQFLAITNNEIDMMYINRDNILREMVKVMDIDDLDLIKDNNTVAMESKAREEQAKADKAFEQNLAMIKAKSGGHMEQQVNEGMAGGGLPGMERLSDEELQQGQIPQVEGTGL
jgi:hypothetical protein